MKLDDAILSEKKFDPMARHARDFNLTMRYEDLKTGICSAVLGTAIGAWTFTGMNARYFQEYEGRLDVMGTIATTIAAAVAIGAYRSYRRRTRALETIQIERNELEQLYISAPNSPSNT
jgi:NO-binding membrane sensor protein with MHYT domain